MPDTSSLCFHCLTPIDAHVKISAPIRGQTAHFCCHGCLGVTQWVHDSGLANYYNVRTGAPKVDSERAAHYASYDLPEIYEKYTSKLEPNDLNKLAKLDNLGDPSDLGDSSDRSQSMRQIDLFVADTHCAACMWLIEKSLQRIAGVVYAAGNASTQALRIQWHDNTTSLSTLLQAIAKLGYRPLLDKQNAAQQFYMATRKTQLKRLAVAGLGMMQVMMYSVALYAGAFYDMSDPIKHFLQWVSFFITTPVFFYAGYPFLHSLYQAIAGFYQPQKTFKQILRSQYYRLNMNVPVGLAITLAYCFSVYHLLLGAGEIYFDSVVMFIFFLSASRYLEVMGKNKAQRDSALNEQILPEVVQKVVDKATQTANQTANQATNQITQAIDDKASNREMTSGKPFETRPTPLASIALGDRLSVPAGDIIAGDGVVISGQSTVDESLLTGEARPIKKGPNDTVFAGSINQEQPLIIEMTALTNHTTLAKTQQLIQSAHTQKPKLQEITDRISAYVVAFILLSTSMTYFVWWAFIDDRRAFEVMLAVLVATCPCALSLSVPTAYASASSLLAKYRIFMRNNMALDAIPKITQLIFDKTGTLTTDDMHLVKLYNKTEHADTDILAIAAALESGIHHPIAKAFKPFINPSIHSEGTTIFTSEGVSGRVNGTPYFIGSQQAIIQRFPALAEQTQPNAIHLCQTNQPHDEQPRDEQSLDKRLDSLIACFHLSDEINSTAASAITKLRHLSLQILSGDSTARVAEIAQKLNLTDYRGEQTPEHKLQAVAHSQQQQQHVMMIGDGINDAPVLAQADVSIAVGNASALSRSQSDMVLPSPDLNKIPFIFRVAKKTRRIIIQNLSLSIGYNVTAIPLAILGFLPPWAAALGMSLSSLVVLTNALRISWIKP